MSYNEKKKTIVSKSMYTGMHMYAQLSAFLHFSNQFFQWMFLMSLISTSERI